MTTRRRPAPPPAAWTPEAWSDGETSALLDAWGPRHLQADGGPLRPADWQACAAAVTSRRRAGGRAPRTVDQCKNRMDYLKKRLRPGRSSPPPPLSASLNRLRKLLHLTPSAPSGFTPGGGAAPKASKEQDDEDDGEEEEESAAPPLLRDLPPVPKRPRTAVCLSPVSSSVEQRHGKGGVGYAEVAAALDRLAGVYEKVQAAKQREVEWLEERRLEAVRDLEIKRMRMLVDAAISTSAGTSDAGTPDAGSPAGGLVEELGH